MTELPIDPIAIDVGHLLQRTVASLYSHLVTRQTGRAVRLAIETQLSEVGERSLSLIDLSEVTVLDFSCADEVVAKLLQHFAGADHTEAFFVFRGVREPHRHQIETVLKRQSLAAVVEAAPGRFELLGSRSSAEEEAWGTLEARGMVAREEVGELFGGESPHEILDLLSLRRLAYRSPITGRYHSLSHLVGKLT